MAPKLVSLAPTEPASAEPTPAQPKMKAEAMQVLSITTAVPMPETTKNGRGSTSKFPFDTMPVGGSFGVIGRTAAKMSSVISAQNRAVKNQEAKKDENGNIVFKMQTVKDAAGNVSKIPTSEPETVRIKKFFAVDTDPATDPDGATVRVFRSA